MKYTKLPHSQIKVSKICLGSMTWGEQNNAEQAFAQLDYALEQGVNFIDTAELYPIPSNKNTQGATETIIGDWMQQRNNREKLVLASKVVGRGKWVDHIRGGDNRLDSDNIEAAINASLKRLKTDYLDLYQVHWPDRSCNFFGQLGFEAVAHDQMTPIEETLQALDDLVKTGKVRFIGLSNETPWGTMRYLQAAEQQQQARIITIQNPYSLLNRSFEVGLAEIAHHEKVGLLAYSPLGFGVLSGKYLHGQMPADARLTKFSEYSRYSKPEGIKATQAYVQLAQQHGLDAAQMALAFVNSRPFVTSTIIGATDLEQLRSNIASIDLTLSDEVLAAIEAIQQQYPNPSP